MINGLIREALSARLIMVVLALALVGFGVLFWVAVGRGWAPALVAGRPLLPESQDDATKAARASSRTAPIRMFLIPRSAATLMRHCALVYPVDVTWPRH